MVEILATLHVSLCRWSAFHPREGGVGTAYNHANVAHFPKLGKIDWLGVDQSLVSPVDAVIAKPELWFVAKYVARAGFVHDVVSA